jgi:hypothetical protein
MEYRINRFLLLLLHSLKNVKMTNRKYEFDENFFQKINTESKAYWLGFIAADGYININKREVNITLAIVDKEHLIKLLKDLNHSDHNVLKYRKTAYSEKHRKTEKVTLNLSSIKMNQDLRDKGLDNNKSETLKELIGIPEELKHHFIRGFFDGNGGVALMTQRTKGYNKTIGWHDKSYRCPAFYLTSTYDFLSFINKSLPFQCKTIQLDTRTAYSYTVSYRSKIRFIAIRDYLFYNATVYLERKFQKIQEINAKLCM